MNIEEYRKHALQFQEEIVALTNKTRSQINQYDILFVGSSSFRIWDTMSKDLAPIKAINHGFGGSRAYDSIYYSQELIFDYHPKIVAIFTGTNDIHGGEDSKTGEEVAEIVQELISQIENRIPNVRIVYFSITLTPAKDLVNHHVMRANQLIKSFCSLKSTRTFIDFTHLFYQNGNYFPQYNLEDSFHLNSLGYQVWTNASKDILMNIVKEVNQ